jgi:hypothetical protein
MIATTTLKKIRAHQPCTDGWQKLLKHLGKTAPDDEVITLKTVLDSNGLDDALWCLRASNATEFKMRCFARLAAQDVLHLWDAPEIVKQYLETGDENIRAAARAAADAAARAAADVAAWAAARAAADAAAWAAAAWAAAWAAAKDAQTERFIKMFCSED